MPCFFFWYLLLYTLASSPHRPAWTDLDGQSEDTRLPASQTQAAAGSDILHLWWEEQLQKAKTPDLLRWILALEMVQSLELFYIRISTAPTKPCGYTVTVCMHKNRVGNILCVPMVAWLQEPAAESQTGTVNCFKTEFMHISLPVKSLYLEGVIFKNLQILFHQQQQWGMYKSQAAIPLFLTSFSTLGGQGIYCLSQRNLS